MGNRTVYGNTISENGWPMVDEGSCNWVTIPGTNPTVTVEIQQGQPTALLRAWAADWNAYVEHLDDADTACWTPTNSVATSNHLSGSALDADWARHPMGPHAPDDPAAGFSVDQVNTIRDMLAFYTLSGVQMIWWGNDWDTPHDSMHSQCGYNTYGNPLTQQFIDQFIRPDGFSTFRRGTAPPPAPGLTAQNLSDAMGGAVSLDRYAQLLPAYRQACQEAGLSGNLNRLAMFAGQLGEESGGLKWMEEIASGAAYEGRADLGNTQPGDGVRFKGRGPIMVTGRHNYASVSQWAFDHGYAPTPTFFVDNPTQLSSDQYGFLSAVWYWTVARPQINSLCDAGDIVGVTKAINGGTNGLQDRTNRWNHCLAMGLAELDVQGTTDPGDDELSAEDSRKIDLIYQEISKKFPSRSPLRHLDQTQFYPGGLVDTFAGMTLNDDGMEHVQYVIALAGYNHPDAMALLNEVAGADPVKFPDRAQDIKLAQAILNKVAVDKVAKATAVVGAPASAPVFVNQGISAGDVATIASAAASAVQQVSPTVVNGATTGQRFGTALDALEALKADLTPAGKATIDALAGVLQTEVGVTA